MTAPAWFCPDDLRPDQKERLQRDWRNSQRRLPPIAPPVDIGNAEAFPNIAEAIEHARRMREKSHA